MQANQEEDRWNRVKAIFATAVEEEIPARRATYLKRACGGDEQLLAEIQALLDAHDESGSTAALLPPEPPPKQNLELREVVADRFRIVRFLGRGGMGEVYEAEDLELGGAVAIKTIRGELLQDPSFMGRFRREVALARQVTHPNVCRVFDVGSDSKDGVPRAFFTMELLDGESLAQLLRRGGKLTPEAALPLVRQMASGLDALHEQGVIHRDFKPGNVMIVQQSAGRRRAVINDFGLARAAEPGDETPISRSGQVFGTPDYMAPEQLLGKPVSPATDIYALGLVMYEMVTGERAFAGGRALENAVQRVTEQPTPPRQKSPDLPVEWEEAILRCLAKDPRARFSSAREVVESLAGPLTSVESASRRPGRSAYSRRLIAAAVVLVLFVALSLAPVRSSWWNRFVGQGPGSVAMLPLSVLTDEAELRVFALGLMETMTARMSQLESTSGAVPLLVVPASEVRSQEAKTAGDAKRKFSADTAVEGTLQRQGNRLRLVLTVVDTGKMRQRETIVLEEDRANPVRLQDAAITRLANALGATLQTHFGPEASHLMTVAPGAYDYYLQARGYLQRTDQAASLESAVTLLQRALNEDSVYAPAHSALGEAYLAQFELTRDPSQMEAALQSGRKGVDLNPNLAETNIALGKIYLGVGRHQDAVQSFEKAIQMDNRKNDAYQGLANAYARLNDFAKAEATYFKAISLRPNDWTSYKALGIYYVGRREFDKAAQQFSKVIDLSPDNAQGYVNLGGAYGFAGRWAEAEKAWLQAQKLDPKRVSTLNNLARLYADRKEYPKAIALYEQVTQLNARSYRTWGQLGKAYAESGQPGKSDECYRKAVSVLESEILVNPNNASMQAMLAFYRAVSRQRNYAQPLRRSLELAPDSVEIQSQAAETYAAAGEKGLAVSLLGEAFRKGYTEQSARGSSHLAPLIEAARRANPGTSNKQK